MEATNPFEPNSRDSPPTHSYPPRRFRRGSPPSQPHVSRIRQRTIRSSGSYTFSANFGGIRLDNMGPKELPSDDPFSMLAIGQNTLGMYAIFRTMVPVL